MTGGSAWCSLETASHVSEKIFSTNDSLKPELMCSFINWTTWPSKGTKREREIQEAGLFTAMYVATCLVNINRILGFSASAIMWEGWAGVGKGGQGWANHNKQWSLLFWTPNWCVKSFFACIPRARKNKKSKQSPQHNTLNN